MTMYGGKKIVIRSFQEDYLEPEDDDEDDDYDCTVVQFWVSPDSDDEHTIGIEQEGLSVDEMDLDTAERVRDAIDELLKWPNTAEGKKEIARLRAKHEALP